MRKGKFIKYRDSRTNKTKKLFVPKGITNIEALKAFVPDECPHANLSREPRGDGFFLCYQCERYINFPRRKQDL